MIEKELDGNSLEMCASDIHQHRGSRVYFRGRLFETFDWYDCMLALWFLDTMRVGTISCQGWH